MYNRETELYYLQSRYYSPKLCRFISADDPGYLGADGTPISYNLFAYCGNNPVMGYDPTGHFSWKDVFNVAAFVTVAAVAVVLIVCSGGSAAPPILAAASALAGAAVAPSTIAIAAMGVAITGAAMMGTALTAGIYEMSQKNDMKKPTSRNQMQKQVESGKAPKEVDRVDKPHINAPNQQNHIHFKDGTAINMDGSRSHESRGIPKITQEILKWILSNGWGSPLF